MVTRQTHRSHLRGKGTQHVLVAQQRKIYEKRRLHQERRNRYPVNQVLHQASSHSAPLEIPTDAEIQEQQATLLHMPEDEAHDTPIHNLDHQETCEALICLDRLCKQSTVR